MNHRYRGGRYSHFPRSYYRRYRCSPYRWRSYYVYPWYTTFYYANHAYWADALSYAPGFLWGFSYGDDDLRIRFGYGYGGGVRFGSYPWVYSWYPYGGYQRIPAGADVPADYERYSARSVSYTVR